MSKDCNCPDKPYYPLETVTPVYRGCDCTENGKAKIPFNFVPEKYVETLADGLRYNCTLIFVKDRQAIYYIDADNVEHLVSQYDVYEDDHEPAQNKYFGTPVYDLKNHKLYKYTIDGKPIVFTFTEAA